MKQLMRHLNMPIYQIDEAMVLLEDVYSDKLVSYAEAIYQATEQAMENDIMSLCMVWV